MAELEKLRVKALGLLNNCRDNIASKEASAAIRSQIVGILSDLKKYQGEEKSSLNEITEQIQAYIIEFMKDELKRLKSDAETQIRICIDEKELQDTKVVFLGKRGKLTSILREMKDLSESERPVMGALANKIREAVEKQFTEKLEELRTKKLEEKIRSEIVDITLPARHQRSGHIHPLDKALREIMKSFIRMGYSVEEGPEIEEDFYNFECLNLPKDHPARDMQDSFYITPEILLRTHTSPVQVRTLRKHIPNSPIRMIAPGKVFRWDNDATHSPVFHQVEGLVVDKDIKFSDLKGTLEIFLKDLFGADTKIRFRASYFPFTEPSAEVDISFASRTHSESNDPDWLEILGCGMVHNMVLKLNGYNPNIVSGFAFGMGIERIAMLLYGIDDLRNFYENDIRFLEQF